MRRRHFVIAIPLLGAIPTFGQDKSKEKELLNIDGVWELDVSYKNPAPYIKFVTIRRVGGFLKVRDLETGQDHTGTITAGGLQFPLIVKGTINEQATRASFTGIVKHGSLEGKTELEGTPYIWIASRLTQLWLCSNHSPKHTAKSKDEMTKSTQENKCEGWYSARSQIPSG